MRPSSKHGFHTTRVFKVHKSKAARLSCSWVHDDHTVQHFSKPAEVLMQRCWQHINYITQSMLNPVIHYSKKQNCKNLIFFISDNQFYNQITTGCQIYDELIQKDGVCKMCHGGIPMGVSRHCSILLMSFNQCHTETEITRQRGQRHSSSRSGSANARQLYNIRMLIAYNFRIIADDK